MWHSALAQWLSMTMVLSALSKTLQELSNSNLSARHVPQRLGFALTRSSG